jgi:hypothetical protein
MVSRNKSKNKKTNVKQWCPSFFKDTPIIEEPFVKTWQEHGADGDVLEIFLRGKGSPRPTWISDVVKGFCHDRPEETGEFQSARAWLDDRDICTGHNRVYPTLQTAQELRSELGKPVRKT